LAINWHILRGHPDHAERYLKNKGIDFNLLWSREPGMKQDFYSILWMLKVTTHVFLLENMISEERIDVV